MSIQIPMENPNTFTSDVHSPIIFCPLRVHDYPLILNVPLISKFCALGQGPLAQDIRSLYHLYLYPMKSHHSWLVEAHWVPWYEITIVYEYSHEILIHTVDGCEFLHQLIGGKHPIILFGFQPSFWWCRISSSIHSIMVYHLSSFTC